MRGRFRCGSLDGSHHLVPAAHGIDSLCRPAGIMGHCCPPAAERSGAARKALKSGWASHPALVESVDRWPLAIATSDTLGGTPVYRYPPRGVTGDGQPPLGATMPEPRCFGGGCSSGPRSGEFGRGNWMAFRSNRRAHAWGGGGVGCLHPSSYHRLRPPLAGAA